MQIVPKTEIKTDTDMVRHPFERRYVIEKCPAICWGRTVAYAFKVVYTVKK